MTSVKKVVNSPGYEMITKKVMLPLLLILITAGVTVICTEEVKQTKMYSTLLERSVSQARTLDGAKEDFDEHNRWTLLRFGDTDRKIDAVCNRVTRVEAKIDHYH